MPKFRVGDIIDYEDIDESGGRFWSTKWKVVTVTQDGYRLQHVGELGVATTFQPFWTESRMRLSGKEEEKELMFSDKEQMNLIQEMMMLLRASPDAIKFMSATFESTYTTVDSADQRRVWVQDFAAALNRRGVLPNENVDRFQQLGYEYMEASE